MPFIPQFISFARVAGLSLLAGATLCAQYRPLALPESWEFEQSTPAYSPQQPSKKLGDFQPGLKVDVLDLDAQSGKWRVQFKRYGSPDIISLIDPPNLALADPVGFARIERLINTFPLLKRQLEAKKPWPANPLELAQRLFGASDLYTVTSDLDKNPQVLTLKKGAEVSQLWGMKPLMVYIDGRIADSPKLVIEVWNKGDAFQSSLDPAQAAREIKTNLEEIYSVFRTTRIDPGADSTANAITALHTNRAVVTLLPNDLRVSVRYKNEEYLILEMESVDQLEARVPVVYQSDQFESRMANNVKRSKAGHVYVSDIPMIDQGKKGYCAAATLARVLQYYGYAVDMHALADLAETEAQLSKNARGGTVRKNILSAMRRICNSTPFRLSEISKAHPDAIRPIIERGLPILWFVPGHARLLIGIHPEKNEIIYSDTWGPEYQYQVGTWEYFYNMNQEMWVLLPY